MKYLYFFLLLFSLIITSCSSEGTKTDIDYCKNNPCANSAVRHKTICKDLGNDYTCICEPGYKEDTDKTCIIDEKDPNGVCKVDSCPKENFECREYNGDALCVCKDGYSLENGNCVSTNSCKNNPCNEAHKTICSRVNNENYICYCDKGYAPNSAGSCVTASYGNYYDSITDDLKDNELIDALYQKIKGHTVIGYNQAESKLHTLDGGKCSYTGLSGLSLNVEHIWPQSYFGSASPMVSDLHHLRLVSSTVNSKRGNVHFGDVVKTDCNPTCYDNCNYDNNCAETNSCCYFCDWDGYLHNEGIQTEAKKGKPSTNCSAHSVFEPIDSFKGDIARSLFYFAVRYYKDNGDINQSQAYMIGPAPYNHIPPYEEIVLRRWHREDPVSQAEINRNNKIFNDYQHNRNPFIDRPDLVDRISDF